MGLGLSTFALKTLKEGRILNGNETPEDMVSRISSALFDTPDVQEFKMLLLEKKVVMSTPIMTNAGSKNNRPLSACIVLRSNDRNIPSRELIKSLHTEGMGTGFNLDEVDDPIATLRYLNDIALENARGGNEDRPVGNMAIMSITNPRIRDFISIKNDTITSGQEWKFNLSVDVTKSFMGYIIHPKDYSASADAQAAFGLFNEIVQNAHSCGDPGLVFMHRFDEDNPAPHSGKHAGTSPCAEVSLVPDETCQFGYINVGKFLMAGQDINVIDYEGIAAATRLLTKALDNILDINVSKYSYKKSIEVVKARRKIGIGICGLADLLGAMRLPYDTEGARELARDLVSFINYTSKLESINLSKERGPFGAFDRSRYMDHPGFIEMKYGNVTTNTVSADMWNVLGEKIRQHGIRNVTTIALPPTGRSALTIDASTGIEPFFTLTDDHGNINPYLLKELSDLNLLDDELLHQIRKSGKISDIGIIPVDLRNAFKTATEISPEAHLEMQAALQQVVDDAISKTINLPEEATTEDVASIYKKAYSLGVKGITVFRIGSTRQPKKVAR